MNPEAGNALLKVLEEPPDRTLLILTAAQPMDLLPTVVSPLQAHPLRPPGRGGDPPGAFKGKKRWTPRRWLRWPACAAAASPRARARIEGSWLSRRDWIVGVLTDLISHSGTPDFRTWLALSERLAGKKDRIEDSLEIITMWLRDILVTGCDPQRVLNRDRMETLAAAAEKAKPAALIEQIDAVEEARSAPCAPIQIQD